MRSFVLVMALAGGSPAVAQTVDVDALIRDTRAVPDRRCPVQADGDVVVCGRRNPDQFRIPEQLRPTGPPVTEQSWDARGRLFAEEERLDGQTIGAAGALKHGQQVVREWRAERARIAREQRELEAALDRQ